MLLKNEDELKLKEQITSLQREKQELQRKNFQIMVSSEQEEEYIANMLLRQIEHIRTDKGIALDLAEKEEEFLINMMTAKLRQLQKEKALSREECKCHCLDR